MDSFKLLVKGYLLSAQTNLISAIYCGAFTEELKDEIFGIYKLISEFFDRIEKTTTDTSEVNKK